MNQQGYDDRISINQISDPPASEYLQILPPAIAEPPSRFEFARSIENDDFAARQTVAPREAGQSPVLGLAQRASDPDFGWVGIAGMDDGGGVSGCVFRLSGHDQDVGPHEGLRQRR